MDIRQIQALHAQYSPQPVVIDIAGHTAAMPLLPAPERDRRQGHKRTLAFDGLSAKFAKAGRPALLCLAVAALAGGGGMSAAKIWRAVHAGVTVPVSRDAHAAASPAPASIAATAVLPVNAAPPRPLTATDFGQQPATQALASVDPRSLTIRAAAAMAAAPTGRTAEASTSAPVAASPIHAPRPETTGRPVAVEPVEAVPQPAVAAPARPPSAHTQTQTEAHVQAQAQQPAAPTGERNAGTPDSAVTKPALRPIRHLTTHRASVSTVETTAAAASSTPPSAAKPPAAKGGDVQLF